MSADENIQGSKDIENLVKLLVTLDAYECLDVIAELRQTHDSRVVEQMIVLLKDEKDYIRQRAAEVLWTVADERAVESLIMELRKKRKLEIVEQACASLKKMDWHPAESKERWLYLAMTEQWEACEAMGVHAVPGLIDVLQSVQGKYNRRPGKAAQL